MNKFDIETYNKYKKHIINKVNNAEIGKEPFFHMYIQNILPDELYNQLKMKSSFFNSAKYIKERRQDSNNFVNRKYSLTNSSDDFLKAFCNLFSDEEIKLAFLKKFFMNPEIFVDDIEILKHECEFVFTPPNKTQDIHTDVPSKYVSMVFYLADEILSEEEQYDNSTFLYDTDLNINKKARYYPNSVCVFAQHFYSYHGFNTTTDRNVLVMFYVNNKTLKFDLCPSSDQETEKKNFKDNILKKVTNHKLIEYDGKDVIQLYKKCKVNAFRGRVKL